MKAASKGLSLKWSHGELRAFVLSKGKYTLTLSDLQVRILDWWATTPISSWLPLQKIVPLFHPTFMQI